MKTYDYWYWNSVFNKKQIKKINSFILKNYDSLESPERGAHDKSGKPLKSSSVKVIAWNKIKPLLFDLQNRLYYINREHFGYDLYPKEDMSGCLFNVYSDKNKGGYGWHYDESSNPCSDIKLTTIINLSDKKYEGGQLELFRNEPMLIKELNEPGSVIMFKSPISHRVLPVIKGERKTLVFFMEGPRFK